MFVGRISAGVIPSEIAVASLMEDLPPSERSDFETVYCDDCAVMLADFRSHGQAVLDKHRGIAVVGDAHLHSTYGPSDAKSGTDINLQAIAGVYSRLGSDLSDVLEGDFSFAIWDSKNRRLTLSRDHFGVRQLFFRNDNDCIWFSDQARLIAGGRRPRLTLSDAADLFMGVIPACEETSFPGVNYLPPAHTLVWFDGDFRVAPYWKLELREPDARDPEAEFRALFDEAVTSRLGSENGVAAMLSGGIDSTSICMVAANAQKMRGGSPLRTYSCVYRNNPQADESHFIDAAVRNGFIDPVKIYFDGHDPLAHVAEVQAALGRPSFAVGLGKLLKIYRTAYEQGHSVVLDGHGGDETISYGVEYLGELSLGAQWLRLLPLVFSTSRLQGEGPLPLLANMARNARPTLTTRALRRIVRMVQAPTLPVEHKKGNSLSAYILGETNVMERKRRREPWRQKPPDYARKVHLATMTSGLIPSGFETLDWAARREGIVARYPFFDRKLVEFCVNLPGHEKIRRGVTRSVLKRSLAGILPDEVARRNDKVDFSGEVAAGLVRYHSERLRELKAGHSRLQKIFNQAELVRAVENVEQSGRSARPAASTFVWRAACLAILVDDNGDFFDLEF